MFHFFCCKLYENCIHSNPLAGSKRNQLELAKAFFFFFKIYKDTSCLPEPIDINATELQEETRKLARNEDSPPILLSFLALFSPQTSFFCYLANVVENMGWMAIPLFLCFIFLI